MKDESLCIGCRDCVRSCTLRALTVRESASKDKLERKLTSISQGVDFSIAAVYLERFVT